MTRKAQKEDKFSKSLIRIFLAVVIGLLAFIAIILIFDTKEVPGDRKGKPTETPKISISIGETLIPVEIADTPEKRTLGLSYRKSLPENEGMLFEFGEKKPVRFWMKGMNFALDLIYIADGKVVQIDEWAMPEPGVPDESLKSYIPNEPVSYVLEVNGGFSEKNNIKVGDTFSL